MPNRPQFIIIGAMKSGTTVLYDFICSHPRVQKATEKEIHYFSLYPYEGEKWYLDHFSGDSEMVYGEASPTYFHVANTLSLPRSIKEFSQDIKLILIVRDPVERAVSHFFHYQKINKIQALIDFDINKFFGRSFEDALKQTGALDYFLHDVLSFSAYYRKYLNYLSVFRKEQILVLTNEQLASNPKETMIKVFGFLDLEYVESEIFGEFRYSTGSNLEVLDKNIKKKLSDFFYEDYEEFCKAAGVDFNPLHKVSESVDLPSFNEDPSDILRGRDGWVFLTRGTNDLLGFYSDCPVEYGFIGEWHALLRARHDRLKKKNIKYLHLFIPDKLSIHNDKTNLPRSKFDFHPINLFYRACPKEGAEYVDSVVNLVPYFRRIKDEVKLYWKTDSHWSYYGCFSAYQIVCSSLGVMPDKSLLSRPKVSGEVALDLGSKCNPQVKEFAEFYTTSLHAGRTYANEIVRYKEKNGLENEPGLHVGSSVIYRNEVSENCQTVVIFGDSFSEYRAALLTGMMAETFREVHFIWSTSLDFDYIEQVGPDIVITEIAERFMPKVPVDNFNLKKYVHRKMFSLV